MNRKLVEQCSNEIVSVAASSANKATPQSFSIEGPAEDQYRKLLDKLLRSGLETRLSRSFVTKKVMALIGELVVDPSAEKARTGLEQLWTDFDAVPTFTVFVPLSGLDAPDSPLELGKVKIRFCDETACDDLVATVSAIIDTTAHTDQGKVAFKELLGNLLSSHVLGQVIAESNVVAEPVRAREIAEEETRKALDVIRYALPALVPKGMRAEIGLMHEVFGGAKLTPLIEHGSRSFNLQTERVGPLTPFKLDQQTVQAMEDLGVFELGAILAKELPTGLERSLIRSLRWFGTIGGPGDADYRLVSGIVCLETLLTPRDREPISNHVAESAALLLGSNQAERRRIKARVKELYGVRSAIAHGAEKPPGERDIDDLMIISGEVIQRVLRLCSEVHTSRDLYDRLEGLKFS